MTYSQLATPYWSEYFSLFIRGLPWMWQLKTAMMS